jgi:predicted AlkP superfamily phosphohydrolase/phosphomutase
MNEVSKTQRILVLALDGVDPKLFARFSGEGLLPHLTRLQREGAWGKLLPVFPPVSPVVWTSFLTGLPPAEHGILDFVTKTPGEYRSATGLYRVTPESDGLFRYQTRRSAPTIFHLLPPGDDFCLWLPATFPAESPPSRMLSGLGAPDVLATLGTSALYTTQPHRHPISEPGYVHGLKPLPTGWQGELPGPADTTLSFSLHGTEEGIHLRLGDEPPCLIPLGQWSPWLEPQFAVTDHPARGLCRFKLLSRGEELALYRTPIWCHPIDPLYPLAQPPELSATLASELGPAPSAGFAGDQWGLRQGLIGRATYLEDAYALWDAQADIARRMVGQGGGWRLGIIHLMVADALQHIFWRDLDPLHPAHDRYESARWEGEIERGYRWLDRLVGELQALAGRDTLLVVLSDHGVMALNRRVDINRYLNQQGYLVLRGEEVEWASSRAFAFGHGGVWVNLVGRERGGCVAGADYESLRTELIAALRRWRDPEAGIPLLQAVWREEASRPRGAGGLTLPDVGFVLAPGYGLERKNLVGRAGTEGALICANRGVWSGGHEGPYRPADIPGMLFLNGPGIPASIELQGARIVDLVPTLMRYLGVQPPLNLGGRNLLPA